MTVHKTTDELFDAIRTHWDCYFEMTAMERAAKYVRTIRGLSRHGDEIEEIAELLDARARDMKARIDELNREEPRDEPTDAPRR